MSRKDGNTFWRWSLDAYELNGVKNRLIYLQDAFGFDVNLSLWCCWRAAQGEILTEDALRNADTASAGWNEGVIEPLREARQNARSGPPALYEQLKEAELAAEHCEQDVLFALSGPEKTASFDETVAAARVNMALYASLLDAPRRDGFSSALLRDLIDHIFPPDKKDSGRT
ncbi:MAG: TIGR02444 family protein [Parvularculaceae bacterium]